MSQAEDQLAEAIASTAYDPLRFVRLVYPWGEPGPLKKHTGPDKWQAKELTELGEQLRRGESPRLATASGHGVGKSALVAWIVHWFVSTRPHPQIVVTANTREQLLKKTFRELAVWHKLMLNKHWFTWTATKFYHTEHPETWFAAAVPWSADHSESFAGTHAEHVLVIFDEASGIDDVIWEVTEGAMTTTGACWLVFGNPTRNTGRFRECFGSYKHRWTTYRVDSRDAKMAQNKNQIQEWLEDYGDDSDFFRVRVKGEFPRAGSTQFIPSDLVERAMAATLPPDDQAVKLIGVDVARFGDDQSVILRRHGRVVTELRKFRGLDTMQLAAMVAEEIDEWQPDCTFVDGVGLGAGVVDRLRSLNYRVIDVQAGGSPDDKDAYANKAAEMWGRMLAWLKGDCQLPKDDGLKDSLIGRQYGYNARMALQLEKKDDMKKRGLSSPDEAEALALTFAEPVRAHRLIQLPEGVGSRLERGRTAYRRPGGLRRDLDYRVL